MTAGEYLIGAGLFAIVAVSAVASAWLVLRRRGRNLTGAARVLAWALVAGLVFFGAHMIPGVLGILSRASVALAALVAVGGAWLLARRLGPAPAIPAPPLSPRGDRASRVLAGVSIAAVATYALAHLIGHFDIATLHSDAATFHLSNIADWIQGGSFWQVDDYVYDRAAGNYPQSGDVFTLAAILPWDSDFLVRPLGYPFVALFGIAVYAAGREMGAPAPTAAIAGAAIVGLPVVVGLASIGLSDPQMLGTFGPGAYFLLRHWRTGDGLDLALAAIGLGLSLGTRWYAVYAVGVVVGVWLVARVLSRRWTLRESGTLVGAIALLGGFWFLRNWVISGNPVFPVRVAPLGIEIFDAPRDTLRERFGYSLADYLTRPGIYRDRVFGPFLDYMALISVALWAAIAAAGIAAARSLLRRLGGALEWRIVAMVACVALIGLAYIATPYTAAGSEGDPAAGPVNARYVIPALAIGAVTAAWLVGRLRARALVAANAVGAVLVVDAVLRAEALPDGLVGLDSLAVALLVVAGGALALPRLRAAWETRGDRPELRRTAFGVAAVVALGVGAVIAAGFTANRYEGLNPTIDYVNQRAPEDRRIGIVGEGWVTYPMFGPRLGNDVEPIAVRREEMLRPIEDRGEFDRAVRAGNYDLVVVQEIDTLDSSRPLEQERWLREIGFVELAEGDHPIAAGVGVRLYAPA